MSNQEILDLLKDAISQLEPRHAPRARALELDSSLVDLGLDSLCITAAAGMIERQLNIQLPDEEVAALFDVPSFITAVRRQLPRRSQELAV